MSSKQTLVSSLQNGDIQYQFTLWLVFLILNINFVVTWNGFEIFPTFLVSRFKKENIYFYNSKQFYCFIKTKWTILKSLSKHVSKQKLFLWDPLFVKLLSKDAFCQQNVWGNAKSFNQHEKYLLNEAKNRMLRSPNAKALPSLILKQKIIIKDCFLLVLLNESDF